MAKEDPTMTVDMAMGYARDQLRQIQSAAAKMYTALDALDAMMRKAGL